MYPFQCILFSDNVKMKSMKEWMDHDHFGSKVEYTSLVYKYIL